MKGVRVTMTQAFHTSESGAPAGYVVTMPDGFTSVSYTHLDVYKRQIRSIGSSPLLKSRVEYRIVGAGEPEFIQSMQSIALELGVSLSYTGWIDDSTLRKEILQADIVTCLRFPTLEATSASCIEALLYGCLLYTSSCV